MHADCRDLPDCIPRGKLKPHTLDLAWKHRRRSGKISSYPLVLVSPLISRLSTPCCCRCHGAYASGRPGLHKLRGRVFDLVQRASWEHSV
jgi:hypothetical protein